MAELTSYCRGAPVRAKTNVNESNFTLKPIGIVRSKLKTLEECPKQGQEGAPDAWIEIDTAFIKGIDDLEVGQEIIILTWLHLARRNELKIHPRADKRRPQKGVFAMRSPHRPNPIGLHKVLIQEIDPAGKIRVYPLEVIDGTAVVDIKSVKEEIL